MSARKAARLATARAPSSSWQAPQRAPQRGRVGARVRAQHLERARADAARRQVDDALEGRVVVAVADQPQVGERVLDLGPLEEPQAPVDAVRDAPGEQVLLEHA